MQLLLELSMDFIMTNKPLKLIGGFHAGPLFVHRTKQIPKKDRFRSGWARRQAEYDKTPYWADKTSVASIYAQCKLMNSKNGKKTWAVDHIIPLNHPLVCGLHIASNLRIISYLDNQKKSNNHWPDMPCEQAELF